jgi:hypothetical protein
MERRQEEEEASVRNLFVPTQSSSVPVEALAPLSVDHLSEDRRGDSTSMASSSPPPPSQSSSAFRSILPHEPLPTEPQGYIHVQGAFTPKLKTTEKVKGVAGAGGGVEIDGEDANANEESSFWTKESLEEALFKILSNGEDDHEALINNTIMSILTQLPFSVEQVQVLDPEPPFTKIRLVYESPTAACGIVSAFRQMSLTPAQLFQNYLQWNHHHHPHDHRDDTPALYTFASRPLQWPNLVGHVPLHPNFDVYCHDLVKTFLYWNKNGKRLALFSLPIYCSNNNNNHPSPRESQIKCNNMTIRHPHHGSKRKRRIMRRLLAHLGRMRS